MRKIYKFGIAIFILMMFYELNSSIVYAGHTSTCKATSSTGSYQKYEHISGSSRHNVKAYCNDCDGYLYQQPENCRGGTATCTSKATCSRCGEAYGDYGDHNYQNNGYCNGKKCSVCSATTGYTYHSYGSWSNYDATRHRRKCSRSGCRNQYNYENHSGGTATCTEAPVCSTCSASYGEAAGHSWATVYTSYDASQHYTQKCSKCNEKRNLVAHEWDGVSDANHQCVYCDRTAAHTPNISAATCTTAKQCTTCDWIIENAKGHNYTGAWSKSSESQHRRKCSRCTSYEYGNHSGGTATCTDPKVCTTCSGYYGEALGHNYTGTWTKYDETQHRRKCSRCTSYEYGNHTGGTATCTAAKVCSTCATAYGDSLGHNYSIACPKCNTANIVCSRNNSHTDTHDCSIYVTPPTVTSIHRWTGSTIRAVATHSNGYYTLSGNPTATNVGTYTATATLKGGTEPTYRWSDTRTTEARTYTWNIYDVAVRDKTTITGPTGVQVKTGETATFKVVATSGTNIRYQWYYNTSNSTSGGTKISGATSSTYSVTTDKSMNNRYYYCVLSNNSDSATTLTSTASNTALLTVWWPHEISAHPADIKVKKDETASFSVTVTGGNPSTYTYQWYSVASATGGTGTKINGATNSTYSYAPTQNISGMWYYCVVSNGKYTLTSNRGKLVADVTVPTVNAGTASVTHANKNVSFTVPITVSDTGEGFNTNSFIASDIVVKVNGTTVNPTVKTLEYKSQSGNNYNYLLTLKGVTGDGLLSLEVAAATITDNLGNINAATSMLINGIIIDNIAPLISSNGTVTGTNQGYINSKDTITVPVKITDVGGINPSEFTVSDIAVIVGGTKDTNAQVTVTYTGKVGNDYAYTIAITNLTGNGQMTLEIDQEKVYDLATNANVKTTITGLNVIVDNIKPIVNNVLLSLGSYDNTAKLYPESLPSYNESWINEDVYAVIKSSDESSGVETYWHSVGNESNFSAIPADREIWSAEMDERDKVFYRVIDRAGNISDSVGVIIKIDKTEPIAAELDMRLNRENGTVYEYDAANLTSKTIFIKTKSTDDKGDYQSEVLKSEYIVTFNNGVTTTTSEIIDGNTGTLLKETGTYTIEVITTDKAGNTSNKFFNAAIDKRTENTVRISNIHDEGSGVTKVTITARKQGASVDAIEPIIIESPDANITQRIKLSDGTFIITVKLEDGVGLVKELKQTITNEL